jgi:tetratricopeptide (TPR) repeat protein
MSAKRFRVAFSFAGEKREFVREVAAILAKRFGEDAILYDKYHKAEFSHANLGFDLPKLYHDETDLIVAVFCPDYPNKEWCGLEWRAIFDLIKKGRTRDVMLTRFSYVDGEGLYSLAGYTDLEGETRESAATLILERLALNEGKPKDHYIRPPPASAPPAHTAILNNLPRLQPFFGREAELAKVAEALDSDSRTWGALIDGPGGMGKTSLAVRAAYDCKPGQFDRIVFVSVKDRELDDDGVRELGSFLIPGFLEMLNELARELGQPDIAKAPEDQRVRLLLDVLRRDRALLILDNLESLTKSDRDQLFTFVKRLPQGCKAILTSRRRIGSGSEELILEQLDQPAALATLADLARRSPLLTRTTEAERVALYEQTGGKPLLLRWVAGQLGRGSCRTVADALAFLRTCPKDNDPLEFIFGDLVDDFSAAETSVLCALTYFTLPATVEHIRALTNPVAEQEAQRAGSLSGSSGKHDDSPAAPEPPGALSPAEVETALGSLANRSLVVPDQEGRTYALVPMVADFLRRRKPEVVAETGDRLDKRAYALVMENGYQKHDRFPVLDAAWPTVAAALPRFLMGSNDRLQAVCAALEHFLDFTGRWDEWLALSRDAEAKALLAKNFSHAGWRAYWAGWVHSMRGQAAEVLACADRAEAHWREARTGARERAVAIRLRGIGHELAEELWRTLGPESLDVAIGLSDLADAEELSGDFAGAERDYTEALRIAKAIDYREIMAGIPVKLASLALDREDWPGAESLARDALALAEKVGRQELIAGVYRCLAKALARQGRKREALPYARRAVDIFTALRSPNLEAARRTLAECEG